jgi:hypothetical protein
LQAGFYYNTATTGFAPWNMFQNCWQGHPGTGRGAVVASAGVQAFAGSGPPTTQKPANGAGTYYDYTAKRFTQWNPTLGYWEGHPGTGTGAIVATLGVQYFCAYGVPSNSLVPAFGAGVYYDLKQQAFYNWNPNSNQWE